MRTERNVKWKKKKKKKLAIVLEPHNARDDQPQHSAMNTLQAVQPLRLYKQQCYAQDHGLSAVSKLFDKIQKSERLKLFRSKVKKAHENGILCFALTAWSVGAELSGTGIKRSAISPPITCNHSSLKYFQDSQNRNQLINHSLCHEIEK